MQSGPIPSGVIHESIEKTSAGLNCRVEIRRKEGAGQYQEFLSAMAHDDAQITPKYFNLRRTSTNTGSTEIIDGKLDPKAGMRVRITGTKNLSIPPRKIPTGTILECYLPTWFKKNYTRLAPGSKHTIAVFAENAQTRQFQATTANVSVASKQTRKSCLTLTLKFQGVESIWCIKQNGV
ncbi:MAG TPA: hypothetical protein PLH57_11415, partial [Oligoflexia bacterium]|nr:hypothetical protein [Oligoflexia bacterium]